MNSYYSIINQQRKFFASGWTKKLSFRIKHLKSMMYWIKANEKEILNALKTDLNKPAFEAYATEIGMVLDELQYTINHIRKWSTPVPVLSTLKNFPSFGVKYPEPYGVALIISPWNYPFMLTVAPLISAIAAGNCAIVKPSAYSPATSSLIACMCEAIFKKYHVKVIEGGRKENEGLLDERFDKILFTGSTAVGRMVMEAASRHLTPVTLELGGKSPCIVDETANIKLAAHRIVWGKFVNAGQTCVAPDYVLTHLAVKHRLIIEMKKAIVKMYGDEPCENVDYPKIINEKHFNRLSKLMNGENIVFGGRINSDTMQIAPTLINGAEWEAPIMSEEIFGPILPVLTYTDRYEAVKLINSRPIPLAMYVFTKRKEAEKFFLRHVPFGGGCINDTVVHLSVPRLPFGGVGESGMGSYHGKAGFDTFTHYKSVLHKSNLIDIPLRYPPYTDFALKLLKIF